MQTKNEANLDRIIRNCSRRPQPPVRVHCRLIIIHHLPLPRLAIQPNPCRHLSGNEEQCVFPFQLYLDLDFFCILCVVKEQLTGYGKLQLKDAMDGVCCRAVQRIRVDTSDTVAMASIGCGRGISMPSLISFSIFKCKFAIVGEDKKGKQDNLLIDSLQ